MESVVTRIVRSGMRPVAMVITVFVVVLAVLVTAGGTGESLAQQATPGAAAPAVISNEVLAATAPEAVAEPELSLSRVTIMPGAVLPVHTHPGSQIGAVVQGELTYTVFAGSAKLYRAGAENGEPEIVAEGDTVVALPGDVLVESPGEVHQARNVGATPVVIYLSSLFPTGAPRSTIVEATPAA
jgi:quercetin dioxygenase-like cupin family protein